MSEEEKLICECRVHLSLPEVHQLKCVGHGKGCPCTEINEKEQNNGK